MSNPTVANELAYIVAKGFSQIKGLDFNQIFSPVEHYETVCLMLVLAALKNWHMKAIDIWSTYLYGELNEEIFMEQPEEFKIPGSENKVLHLKKALYDLKQPGLTWWNALDDSMRELGFEQIKFDPGIFLYKRKGTLMVVAIVYVDNAVFCGPSKAIIDEVKGHFMRKWKCWDVSETTEFLYMCIKHHGYKIYIDQHTYLDKIIKHFGLQNVNFTPIPLPQGYYPICNNGLVNPTLCTKFQTIIGSLLYIMISTQPDIAYAVTILSKHSANPTKEHVSKTLYICCYLLGIPNVVLHFNGNQDQGIIAFTNVDWAFNPNNCKSQAGWFLKLAGYTFLWCSHQQPIVAHLSTMAEYMSLLDCDRQAFWICQLLGELGYKLGLMPIYRDNQGSIFMASNAVTEQHSKPINIQWHVIHHWIKDHHIKLFFINGASNPTDIFTKNLGCVKFEEFRQGLGLVILWGHLIIYLLHIATFFTIHSCASIISSKVRGSVELHIWSLLL